MPNLNKVMLMGNLTRDPELRYTTSNTPVANIGLAVNRRWRNQQGEQQEETTFIDCEAWARTAEVMSQYLRKGRPVFIEGRLRLDQWQDQQGNNRSKLKVVIDGFEFLDSGGGGGDGAPGPGGSSYAGRGGGGGPSGGGFRQGGGSRGGNNYPPQEPSGGPAHEPIPEDDIPF